MSDDETVRERVERRLRASTMREVMRLRTRTTLIEQAMAENRSLQPGLAQVVAEIEERVTAYERGLSHASPDATDG